MTIIIDHQNIFLTNPSKSCIKCPMDNYELLEKHFGNHTKVAQRLRITPRHYRRIRNGQLKPSKPLASLIQFIVKDIKAQNPTLLYPDNPTPKRKGIKRLFNLFKGGRK